MDNIEIGIKANRMAEETWHGIPRNKIPWYPTIDYEKCVSCGKCVDYCNLVPMSLKKKTERKNQS